MDFDKFVKSIVNKKPVKIQAVKDTEKHTEIECNQKEDRVSRAEEPKRKEVSDEEFMSGFRSTRMGLGYKEVLEPTKAAQALLKIRRTAIKKIAPPVKAIKKTQQVVPLQNEKGGKARKTIDPILRLKEQRKRKAERKALARAKQN
eukprot:TRINITY_DN1509_c0_g1_i13.p1 TRINITY_DN1509_c0_g1~~TRINITY_DN1509_c0_g1_i13.p1  ORF type:complete len:146 (-),score=40.89 TRINITY_DN1509_c0_g1_i13:124-561(-)